MCCCRDGCLQSVLRSGDKDARGMLVGDVQSRVAGAVIDHDDLVARLQGFQRTTEPGGVVEGMKDSTNGRHAESCYHSTGAEWEQALTTRRCRRKITTSQYLARE